MITNHNRFTGILLLALSMFCAPAVTAQTPQIASVDPASALQGTLGQEVTITGSGFDKSAKVAFYKTGTEDPGGIAVRSSKTSDSGTIFVIIDIADNENATGDYDVEVRLGGRRGGKGTTAKAFSVSPKTKVETACGGPDGVFKDIDAAQCNCKFVKKDEGGQGTPSVWIWALQGNCWTRSTLMMPQYEALNGNGHTLTALPNLTTAKKFNGSSVIANSGHRTHVFSLNIAVDKSITNAGCDDGDSDLNSAIGFVLDGTKEYPEESTDKDGRIYALTRLRTWGIGVDSAVPLCRAIEFRREPSYDDELQKLYENEKLTQEPEYYMDAVVLVGDVMIMSGSYSEAGIQVSGFVNAEIGGRSGEKIGIADSTVMGGVGSGGSAILFGPVYGPGTVAQNAVSANGGIGIEVAGDGTDDVRIENNNVVGADTAIWVDDQVDSVYFKSNVLDGDPSSDDDVGIDISSFTDSTYRSNRITDFDCAVLLNGECQD
jgi:hypothetical protein